jgi:hypothetical protein
VECDGCGQKVLVGKTASTRPIPPGWRRIHVRQFGNENKPDSFDICSPACGAKAIEKTYEIEPGGRDAQR